MIFTFSLENRGRIKRNTLIRNMNEGVALLLHTLNQNSKRIFTKL